MDLQKDRPPIIGDRVSPGELTKMCVRKAFLYLLGEKDFEKISVTEICKRAGVSRSSFYRNYEGKNAVIEDIGNAVFDELVYSGDAESQPSTFKQWMVVFFDNIRENKELLAFLNTTDIPSSAVEKMRDTVKTVYYQGQDISDYALTAIVGAVLQVVQEWYRLGMKESSAQMADVLDNFLRVDVATSLK